MTYANLNLNGSFSAHEWPDFIDVRHSQVHLDGDMKRYWPERSVTVARQYDGDAYDNWFHYACECGCEWEQWRTLPRFCPNCRGRIRRIV